MEEKIHVQVKDNSPSIERILRPISYTSWLLGVSIAHPRKCPKAITIIIRIIYMAVCSYFMVGDIKDFFTSHLSCSDNENVINVDIYYINRMICNVSIYYYNYHGIRQYNKWPELMDRLKELDQKIRKEISMNDRSIKIIETLVVFTTFTLCPLMPIILALYDYYYTLDTEKNFIERLLRIYTMLAQSFINSFVFAVIVYVLYCRFQTINKLIDQLDKLSDVQWIAFKIRRIRELQTDICDLANMVNDIHGLHLLFWSVNCFTEVVTTLCIFYVFFKQNTTVDVILYIIFSFVHTMHFCLICWVCTLTCQESNRTGIIIHKIIPNCKPVNLVKHEASNQSSLEVRPPLENLNDEQKSNCSSCHNPYVVENFLRRNLDQECVIEEVNDFLTQLQQNRVSFTACDFFEINNASFGCFVGVIFTYLIAFVQFY